MRDRISNLYQFVLGVIESIYMQCRLYTVRKNGRAVIRYFRDKRSLHITKEHKETTYVDLDAGEEPVITEEELKKYIPAKSTKGSPAYIHESYHVDKITRTPTGYVVQDLTSKSE